MVKLPGSFIFAGSFCWITALQVAVKFTIPFSAIFLFLLSISFRNFASIGIWLITSAKWDIDFYFLENVQESRKLLFPFCFLKPLGKWHDGCISWYSFLLFLLITSFRLFSLCALLSFLSSLFLFYLSLFFPFFPSVVAHFFPTS